jgi:FkbM family methyltransferase
MRFYSQQGEDRFLYENFLNYRDGIFIELGAMNGITFSNSLFFEQELNWKGILIEPTYQYNQLIQNRPNCFNFNYAVSEIDGEVEFIGNEALGGIRNTMHDNHFYGWKLNEQTSYLVKSKPIKKIIDEINEKINKVDFFSIDVEGGELEVLNTYDWEIPTYVILIEMSHDIDRNEKCRELLKSKNFTFNNILGCNEVWINKNYQK